MLTKPSTSSEAVAFADFAVEDLKSLQPTENAGVIISLGKEVLGKNHLLIKAIKPQTSASIKNSLISQIKSKLIQKKKSLVPSLQKGKTILDSLERIFEKITIDGLNESQLEAIRELTTLALSELLSLTSTPIGILYTERILAIKGATAFAQKLDLLPKLKDESGRDSRSQLYILKDIFDLKYEHFNPKAIADLPYLIPNSTLTLERESEIKVLTRKFIEKLLLALIEAVKSKVDIGELEQNIEAIKSKESSGKTIVDRSWRENLGQNKSEIEDDRNVAIRIGLTEHLFYLICTTSYLKNEIEIKAKLNEIIAILKNKDLRSQLDFNFKGQYFYPLNLYKAANNLVNQIHGKELKPLAKTVRNIILNQKKLNQGLITAARNDDIEGLENLLKRGASPYYMVSGYTALHEAARYGACKAIKFLIEFGIDPDIKGKEGRSPLHSAAFNNRKQACEILIESRATVDFEDKYGRIPLYSTIRKCGTQTKIFFDAFLTLISSSANINHGSQENRTILHYAVIELLPGTCSFLIKNGADPHKLDDNNNSPLSIAIDLGSCAVVEAFFKAGANPLRKMHDGRLLESLAIDNNDRDMQKLIQKYSTERYKTFTTRVLQPGEPITVMGRG